MQSSGIYQILNKINNKRYIGSAVNIIKRWRLHKLQLKTNKHCNHNLQRAWNKYGENNFEFIVLLKCTKEELILKEQSFLDWFKPEYNICKIAGNTLGYKMPKEIKQKLSIIHANVSNETKEKYRLAKLGKKASEETRIKMSNIKKGEKNHFFGKKHTEENLKKISESAKGNQHRLGIKHTEETKLKISEAGKGRVITEETRQKMSESRKGPNNPNFNKIFSKETREKMRIAKLGRKLTSSQCKAISERQKGKKQTAEQIAARTGKKRGSYKAKKLKQLFTRDIEWEGAN